MSYSSKNLQQFIRYLIFYSRCINGFLAKKLRVLVTHQLQYLPHASKILVINKVGIVILLCCCNYKSDFANGLKVGTQLQLK